MTRPYRRLLAALVSALAGLTLALMPAGSAHAAHGQAFLDPGETLLPGQYLVAGNYRLVMQRDGNLVYYQHYGTSSQRACAASHTTAHPGSRAWMSPNGTFSVYTPEGHIVWTTAPTTVGSDWSGGYVVLVNTFEQVWVVSGSTRYRFPFWRC